MVTDIAGVGMIMDKPVFLQIFKLLKTDDPFDANHPRFSNAKFWGPATNKEQIIKYGYKMKRHNFGPGRNQLRLCIVIMTTELEGQTEQRVFLYTGYVKDTSRALKYCQSTNPSP